ncbi:hypothetical protein Rs2_31860 [Raphanus sativus]|nr:hypothetical protein Rs2_31860 [Raphanus sativus]
MFIIWLDERIISKLFSIQYTAHQSLEDWLLFVKILVVTCLGNGQSSPMCYFRLWFCFSGWLVFSLLQCNNKKRDSTSLPCSSDDSFFTEASRQFTCRCLTSVYRVHLAPSRDVVLDFASLFYQLSQARRVYTAYKAFLYSQENKKHTLINSDSHQTRTKDSTRQKIDHMPRPRSSDPWILG